MSTETTTAATESYKIAVVGAGGKMGMRVSNNLVKTNHTVWYVENSPAGQQRTTDAGRELTQFDSFICNHKLSDLVRMPHSSCFYNKNTTISFANPFHITYSYPSIYE